MSENEDNKVSPKRAKRRDYAVRWKWVGFFTLLGPLAIGVWYHFGNNPELAEQFFGKTVYPITGQGVSIMSAWLPFALMDLVLVWIVIWPLWLILKSVVHYAIGRRTLGNLLKRGFARIFAFSGLGVFLFMVLWGFNYQRPPLAERLDLAKIVPSKKLDLKPLERLVEDLVVMVNRDRAELAQPNQALTIEDRKAFFDDARKHVDHWAKDWAKSKEFPEIQGHFGDPKSSYFSPAMAALGIHGVYFPFTGEPIVSSEIPDCRVPFVALHEIAHQRGIAREADASLFAWLASRELTSAARLFRYSTNLEMLWLCRNNLLRLHNQRADQKSTSSDALAILEDLLLKERDDQKPSEPSHEWDPSKLLPDVILDLKALEDYERSHRSELVKTGRKVNDAYIKASGQEQGIAAYDAVITLVLRLRATKERP